jgi:hypothetical protein
LNYLELRKRLALASAGVKLELNRVALESDGHR